MGGSGYILDGGEWWWVVVDIFWLVVNIFRMVVDGGGSRWVVA